MQSSLLSNVFAAASGSGDSLSLAAVSAATNASSTNAAPFFDLLKNAIASEQSLEAQASSAVQALMSGSGIDVHQVMIATQKANLAFEMALAVRSKAVAAYQQVMQMQF